MAHLRMSESVKWLPLYQCAAAYACSNSEVYGGRPAKPLPATKVDLEALFDFCDEKKSSMYHSGYTPAFADATAGP